MNEAKLGQRIFTIVGSDKPLHKEARRIGFLCGADFQIPSQSAFEEIGLSEIEAMFIGERIP